MRLALGVLLFVGFAALARSQNRKLSTPGELTQAAKRAYQTKDYARCGDLYSRLGEEQTVRYSAACCFALAGEPNRAFQMLGKAVDDEWVDRRTLETDPDLVSLHHDARWTDVLSGVEANWARKFSGTNRELWNLREDDQADRENRDSLDDTVRSRDGERLNRVKTMLASGALKTGWDYFNAALIFQHGTTPDDFKKAHELAIQATTLDPANQHAKILAADAEDRYLLRTGKPQIYGTQYRLVDGKWVLEWIDETAVTDEERARYGLPPLVELKARVIEMNKKRRGTDTANH